MSTTRKAGSASGDEKHENHSERNPAAEAGMSRDVINIGQHIFKDGIRDYSEREQELLEWLWGYTFDELNGSRKALCDAVGYDYTVIWKIFTGKYEATLDRFCEAIEHLKRKAAAGRKRLVETPVTEKITEALNYARDTSSMVAVTGPTGRSKTYTAIHWSRDNNHGRAKYIRIPSACSRAMLVRLLCQACGVGVNGKKTPDLEARLFKCFNFRNTIIVDEAGHLIPRAGSGTSAIEFLRDLHDMCHCGVAMIFTDVYLEEFRHGRMAPYFEQYLGRLDFTIQIPRDVLRQEAAAVVRSFHPEPPQKLISLAFSLANNRDGKLRTLFKDMQRAADWAANQDRQMTVEDLKLASDWRLSGGVWPDDDHD